jgi:hypothetical protein
MKRILGTIEGRKEELTSNRLFGWLSDERISGAERLAFAPAMLYFLMGFKDVLSNLARPDPKTDLDRMVNAYCTEDALNWQWYLDDLERLGFTITSWGKDIPALCKEIWSASTAANRDTIFALIHYSRMSDDPLLALTLVQILEATGELFLINTRKAGKAANMDDRLLYLGRVHYETELGHSVQPLDLQSFKMSEATFVLADKAVPELFGLFDRMMDCWYEHRDRYQQTTVG